MCLLALNAYLLMHDITTDDVIVTWYDQVKCLRDVNLIITQLNVDL